MTAYYNEKDPYAAQWLRNLIAAGHIMAGDVDERSIEEISADDLKGYTRHHFFAGIGGWDLALQLAGWPADRPVWTGSCPCQPFSAAGKQKGKADARHLWPAWFNLIRQRNPSVIFGEQVASAIAHRWLDEVALDLEGEGYAVGSAVLPACSVNAPHKRDRLWVVANSNSITGQQNAASSSGHEKEDGREGRNRRQSYGDNGSSGHGESNILANSDKPFASEGRLQRSGQQCGAGCDQEAGDVGHTIGARLEGHAWHGYNGRERDTQPHGSVAASSSSFWDSCEWVFGPDGKARPVEPGIRLLAHGVPARVGKLRAYGNAIVPQVAAEFVTAYLETTTQGEVT